MQEELVLDQQEREYILQAFNKSRMQRFVMDKMIVGILSLCAILVLFALFSILFHLMVKGISAVNLEFLTHLPKPVGD